MSSTTFGHTPAELEEKLATYWQLVEEREKVEERVAKARSEKDSVNERIFRKVIAEYESSLESMGSRLAPLKNEIEELRRTTTAELKTLESVIQELEDEVAEARFRRRVGEYDDAVMNEAVGRLEPRIKESRQQHELLAAQLEAMDRRRQSEPVPKSQPEPAPSVPEAPETAPDNVENPRNWADQLEPVEPRGASTVSEPVAAIEEEDDPLSALSDPSPQREHSESRQATSTQTRPERSRRAMAVAPSYPSLVIRSGAHQGKIVPLLPMTMSIGREHDNNIELKDPDVARYHARVLYEEGRFLVEDLESSSGTWVNGVRQRRTALSDGDVIRIGGTELQFEFA